MYIRISFECPGGTLALGSPVIAATLADNPLRNSVVARASMQAGRTRGAVSFFYDDGCVFAFQYNINRHHRQGAGRGGNLAIVAAYHGECGRRLNIVAAFSDLLLFVGACVNANASDL